MFSESKGFAIPNIIVGAFLFWMLRPQFSQTFTNENQLFTVETFPKNRFNKLFSVSVQKVRSSASFKPHLKIKQVCTGKYAGKVFKFSVSGSHKWGRMNIHPIIYL